MAAQDSLTPRAVARTVFTAVLVVLSLYLIYLLREPIGWLLIATFLAVALSGPGQPPPAPHEARLRDRARLPRAAARPGRDRGDRGAPDRRRGQRPGRERAGVRAGRDRLRERQRDAARHQRGLRRDREDRGGGGQAAVQDRRRRRGAARRGLRHRQLGLRARHDPDPHGVHARRGARLDPLRAALRARGPRRAARARVRARRRGRSATTWPARWPRPRSPPSPRTSC